MINPREPSTRQFSRFPLLYIIPPAFLSLAIIYIFSSTRESPFQTLAIGLLVTAGLMSYGFLIIAEFERRRIRAEREKILDAERRDILRAADMAYLLFDLNRDEFVYWNDIAAGLLDISEIQAEDGKKPDLPGPGSLMEQVKIRYAAQGSEELYHSLKDFIGRRKPGDKFISAGVSLHPGESERELLCRSSQAYPGRIIVLIGGEYRESLEELQVQLQRLTTALRQSGIGYYDWNLLTGAFTHSPDLPAMRKLLAGGKPPRLQDLINRIHPQDRPAVWNHFEDVIHRRSETADYRFRVAENPDSGKWRWLREMIWGSWTNDGRCRQIFAVNMDISTNMERERQLRRARDMAEESNRSKNEFLANMSHEIRTPLNAILGFSEIIAGEAGSESLGQYARTIQRSGQQLFAMLDNILTLAKIEAGRVPLQIEEFSIFSLQKEIEQTYSSSAEAKGLKIRLESDPDLPRYLVSDREKIMRILSRLVDNAVKFSRKGVIDLHFSLRNRQSGGGTLTVRIDDEGIGMAPERLGDYRAMFTQGEQNSTRKYGGSGLGLTISSRLIDLLEGSLEISSRETGGTRIVMQIPVEKIASSQEANSGDSIPLMDDLTGYTALSVDDSYSNQLLLARMLEARGCTVHRFESSVQAVDALAEIQPDMIFMDINMPEMDGWQCLSEMGRRYPELLATACIIVLSGDDPDEHGNKPSELAVDGFLTKPFSKEQLYGLLSPLLTRRIDRPDDGATIAAHEPGGYPGTGNKDGQEAPVQSVAIEHARGKAEHMPPEVIKRALEHSVASYLRATERMRLQDIISFASLLKEESQDYPDSDCHRLAVALTKASERFDIDEMRRLLNKYRSMLQNSGITDGDI